MIKSGIVVCPKCNTRVLPRQDGTCPSCQARLLPKESDARRQPDRPGNAAPYQEAVSSRAEKALKKGATNDAVQSRGPDDSRQPRIRLSIEGAIRPTVFADVGVGDLLLVDSDVYFICYSSNVTLTGRAMPLIGGLNAGLVGAVIGGLAGGSQDKARLEDERKTLANSRKPYYALSLDERVEQLRYSMVIRNPASVTYDAQASSITCTSSTGEKSTFAVPPLSRAARAVLAEFPEGEDSLYPAEDPYGLLVWSSSPKVLTDMLMQGQADAAFLDRVASHQLYMQSFYRSVRGMPEEQQDVLIENLRGAPARFRASMSLTVADTQQQDAATGKNLVKLGRLVGLILLVFSLAFLSSQNYFALAGLALLGLACLVYIPYFANSWARRHERLMQAILDAVGPSSES